MSFKGNRSVRSEKVYDNVGLTSFVKMKLETLSVRDVLFLCFWYDIVTGQLQRNFAPDGLFQPPNCQNDGLCQHPPDHLLKLNPLLAALTLSQKLHLHPDKIPGFNRLEHLPVNPYFALLLSHYGKYTPIYGKGHNLYGYVAANNYHNNQPVGSYKIYEDDDG